MSKATLPREVLARVKAQARRLREPAAANRVNFTFSGFEWDLRRREISAPDGSVLTLSSSEIALLVAFLQSGGRELSREELRDLVGRDGVEVSVRAIDSHVSRLRRKLGERGGAHLISTVYGVGYRWAGDDHVEPAPARPAAARHLRAGAAGRADAHRWSGGHAAV